MNQLLLAGLLNLCVACGSTTPAPTTASSGSGSGSDQPCGYDILARSKEQGGACLEPSILGADRTRRCQAFLEQNGWKRDGMAESALGQQTGKAVICFRAPE